jgi:hypothetical protein
MRDNKMNGKKSVLGLFMLAWDVKDAYHPLEENISKKRIDRFNNSYKDFSRYRAEMIKNYPGIKSKYSETIESLTGFVMKLGNKLDYHLVKASRSS